MNRIRTIRSTPLTLLTIAMTLISAIGVSCGSSPTPITPTTPTTDVTPTATTQVTVEPTIDPRAAIFADVPGIVDPTNFGWPRTVETSSGVIEIEKRPERIYSISLGHAEMIAALRGGDVLVASASFFKDPATSAAHEEFASQPDAGSDPEEIIGLNPEIVIVSTFTSADLVAQLTGVGVQVVRAELEDSALGNVPNILLLGYMLGAEERAAELAQEVTDRVQMVSDRVDSVNPDRPRVLALSKFSDIFVAGEGSTEGGIIVSAGAVNAAAEAGIMSHQATGIEGIAAINPDMILVTQPEESALELAEDLYSDPALADVPAIVNRKIIYGDPTFFTTLSHWNVRGIEEAARFFFPELFLDETFEPFTHP